MRWLACMPLIFVLACGDNLPSTDVDAAGTGPDAATGPALGALMPQATAHSKTAVIATPTVIPFTYDDDPNRTDIETFFPQYAASPAWAQQTAEWGIGPLTIGTPIHLPAATEVTTDDALQALLTTNLSGATPAWGQPSENVVYSFFLPAGASFTDGTGSDAACCVGYDGYHDDFEIGSADIAYAIQCMCGSDFPPTGITALQELTTAAAHETVEAVTDPRFESVAAWDDVDAAHEAWTYVTEGELADLCEFSTTAYWTSPPDMTYSIQRIWSNAAAKAGTDPCVGDPTVPYYQTVPDAPDTVVIAPYGRNIASKGTKIALDSTGALTLTVAGTPGSGPFIVVAEDVTTYYLGASKPALSFIQPTGLFNIGDTVTIPTTVKRVDTDLGGPTGAEAFEIDTMPMNGGPTTLYWGLVGQ